MLGEPGLTAVGNERAHTPSMEERSMMKEEKMRVRMRREWRGMDDG
jgi:hypothetical protein